MQEVHPTIFNLQISGINLSQCLVHEIQLAAVIEFPGNAILREDSRSGDR